MILLYFNKKLIYILLIVVSFLLEMLTEMFLDKAVSMLKFY